jgi:argininosuccinate lyase
LAEDLILWNSKEFGFIRISDAYATGSSLMPQKKNPDILELVRGRSGSIFGNLIAILTTMKGLPLAYNRDMQEDKGALFESVRITRESLKILANVLRAIEVDRSACERAVSDSLLYATDLLEYLVAKGTAFQDAHELVGKMVRHSLSIDRELRTLSFKELKRFSPLIERDVYDLFDPKKSLSRKRSLGSTHPDSVRRQIAKWKKNLSRFKRKFSH